MFQQNHSLKWTLEADDFSFFQKNLEKRAGITLKSSKTELMLSRLRRRAVQLGFHSLRAYRLHLESLDQNAAEWQHFINQLTTNKTDFFREPEHFDYLVKEFLPHFLKQGKEELNVWTCASSTGEEPYTLAMVLGKNLPEDFQFNILATDIDTEVLALANNGVYSNSRLHEIPESYSDCLAFGSGEVEGWFALKKKYRERIQFQQHNLMSDALPCETKFDLVFCRNVLIYFGREGIEHTAKKIFSATSKNGQLIIGHSESLQSKSTDWKMKKPSLYYKN